MATPRQYFVYILSNKSKTLYIGVTNDLARRVCEHKTTSMHCFTNKYNISRLVYFEVTTNVWEAIAREKQLKGWLRRKKIALIESMNPTWKELSTD